MKLYSFGRIPHVTLPSTTVFGGIISANGVLKIQAWTAIIECAVHALLVLFSGSLYFDSLDKPSHGMFGNLGALLFGAIFLYGLVTFIPIAIAAAIYSPFVTSSVSANFGL